MVIIYVVEDSNMCPAEEWTFLDFMAEFSYLVLPQLLGTVD